MKKNYILFILLFIFAVKISFVSAGEVLVAEAKALPNYPIGVINDPDGYTNVRSGPGKNYSVITKIYKGEYFIIKSTDGEWWSAIAPNGKEGYIHKSRVKIVREDAILTGYINDPDGYTNVRSGPGKKYSVVAKVYEGEMFIILETGEWHKIITKKGIVGYMHYSRINSEEI